MEHFYCKQIGDESGPPHHNLVLIALPCNARGISTACAYHPGTRQHGGRNLQRDSKKHPVGVAATASGGAGHSVMTACRIMRGAP